jgi:predicted aldo/keto reductase-like oxidoreductase
MEGLLGGKLANVPADVKEVLDSYGEDRSAAEWAFRWLCDDEAIGTVLSGVISPEMTADNLRIFDAAHIGCMSDAEKETVKRARKTYAARIKVGCTNCRYCMPCHMGVSIPRIFSAWNDAYKYDDLEEGKRRYANALSKQAGANMCIGCGLCEEVCPQHIDIRNMLQKAHRDLT